MRRQIFTLALIFTAVSFAGVTHAEAQEEVNQSNSSQSPRKMSVDARPNMLVQLGLAREQIQQIRRLNLERKPVMQAAQLRFRESNRLLDEAIYADITDEALIEVRLKEVQLAQVELQRIRYSGELSIRKILTPDQLVRFRAMRQLFESGKVREQIVNRRRGATITDPSDSRPIRQMLKQKRQRAVQ